MTRALTAALCALTLLGCGAASPTEAEAPSPPVEVEPARTSRPTTRRTPRNTAIPTAEDFPMDPVTHVLRLPAPIAYDTGKATLRKQSDAPLGFVRDYLERNPGVTLLRIEGHSDNLGSDAANDKLTRDRAVAAARWLIDHGIDCGRLIAVGFGERKPLTPNTTAESRAKNRRIDFVEASFQGRSISGEPVDGGGLVGDLACP